MESSCLRSIGTLLRRSVLALAVAGLGVSHTPDAHAQLFTSETGPSLPAHLMNQYNTLTTQMQAYFEYGQQAARWKATWDHYYQQVARFMSLVRSPTLSNKVSFEPVPMDFGVQERCGGTGGFSFSVSSLANTMVPDLKGNIRDNQRKLCAQIQMLENQKYNATVRYFKEVAPTLKEDMEAISEKRRENNEQGTLAAIAEASARLQTQQETSGKELDNQVNSCDRLIATLTAMQQNLARQALNGAPDTAIGTMVKTATLEAALKVK